MLKDKTPGEAEDLLEVTPPDEGELHVARPLLKPG
jgi:hypothetical protein